jgi:hypothetical protein
MNKQELVEIQPQEAELVPVAAAPPASLFRTDDPVEVLKKAKAVADALAPVIKEAGLVASIQGKEYLKVEAWQTLGQQVGVTPVVVSTKRLTEPEEGWEARCEARTLDGRTIGAADSMCLRNEERWKDSDDFEIRSMAQTRAMSRALASVLRFIPTLAGMAGTPAEEMDRVRSQGSSKEGGGSKGFNSDAQRRFFEKVLGDAGLDAKVKDDICEYVRSTKTKGEISNLIDALKDENTRSATASGLQASAAAFSASLNTETPDTHQPEPTSKSDEDIPF